MTAPHLVKKLARFNGLTFRFPTCPTCFYLAKDSILPRSCAFGLEEISLSKQFAIARA